MGYFDKFFVQNFAMEDLMCTPRLVQGDLLVLRGDTPHRTQYPIRSHRVTLSIRYSMTTWDNAELWTGGMVKYSRLYHGRDAFAWLAYSEGFGRRLEELYSPDWNI